MVAKGALHCGSGCTPGDICAEFLALAIPAVAVATGWRWLLPASPEGKLFAVWVLDYLFAFRVRRGVPVLHRQAHASALREGGDRAGDQGRRALAHFALFEGVWRARVTPAMPAFWFKMQVATLVGFATAFPVNWWLIRSGVKEEM